VVVKPMAGMPMPDEAWPGAAGAFLVTWVVMMAAMMLPSLAPVLQSYRRDVARVGGKCPGLLTGVVGAAYLAVWAVVGAVVFALGAALTTTEMRMPAVARALPVAVGVVVLGAGLLQLTAWKAHRLACWRDAPWGSTPPGATATAAWQSGLRLGVRCGQSCAGLMVVLVGLGAMDLRVMAVVTAAITAERLAPAGERVARAVGVVVVGMGLCLIARAAALLLAA
jgi:predicted metal-binding membrane protein